MSWAPAFILGITSVASLLLVITLVAALVYVLGPSPAENKLPAAVLGAAAALGIGIMAMAVLLS